MNIGGRYNCNVEEALTDRYEDAAHLAHKESDFRRGISLILYFLACEKSAWNEYC